MLHARGAMFAGGPRRRRERVVTALVVVFAMAAVVALALEFGFHSICVLCQIDGDVDIRQRTCSRLNDGTEDERKRHLVQIGNHTADSPDYVIGIHICLSSI